MNRPLQPMPEIPAAERRTLLAYAMGIEPKQLLLHQPNAQEMSVYQDLLERRAQGIPLQYLTGVAYFRRVQVAVGPGVFIPRPETELLVGWALEWLRERTWDEPGVAVELCSGSGAISLALADEAPGLRQYAAELDPVAFEWGRHNLARTTVEQRLADLATAFPELDGQVDLLIANPPYIPETERPLVAPDVLAHEPQLALFSGPDGLDAITALIETATRLLRRGGALCFEHAESNAPTSAALLCANPAFTKVETHPDLNDRPRFTTGLKVR